MSVYNCEHCEAWLDDDYFPAEYIENAKGAECPLCEDCFIDYIEDKENENE
jgi:DNA-directed RNA polymerase subunit RPC12/RpoP